MESLQYMLSMDNLQAIVEQYGNSGTLMGMFLTFIEAFLPFLPLSVFVVGNAASHGLLMGFLISSIGSIAGCWAIYGIFRFFGDKKCMKKFTERSCVKKYTQWLEKRGFAVIALLCMLPVFPNSVITIVAGLKGLSFKRFAVASAVGIMGLTFILSLVGQDLFLIIRNPLKGVIVLLLFASISWIGRMVEKRTILSN